jgi:hypothetical protein
LELTNKGRRGGGGGGKPAALRSDTILRGNMMVWHLVHRHEPPVLAQPVQVCARVWACLGVGQAYKLMIWVWVWVWVWVWGGMRGWWRPHESS